MGILQRPLDWMQALNLPRPFDVCELGDQYVTAVTPRYLAREFYEKLGCGRYESVDGNGKGTVTADLNRPLAPMGLFDLVTDFGTGEHVFNQHQVWKTLHDLCKPSGFIVFDRPAKGYDQHCFYLVNECLIQDIAAENNYRLMHLEHETMPRGELIRGVFQKRAEGKFRIPQQGRYHKALRPIR